MIISVTTITAATTSNNNYYHCNSDKDNDIYRNNINDRNVNISKITTIIMKNNNIENCTNYFKFTPL